MVIFGRIVRIFSGYHLQKDSDSFFLAGLLLRIQGKRPYGFRVGLLFFHQKNCFSIFLIELAFLLKTSHRSHLLDASKIRPMFFFIFFWSFWYTDDPKSRKRRQSNYPQQSFCYYFLINQYSKLLLRRGRVELGSKDVSTLLN